MADKLSTLKTYILRFCKYYDLFVELHGDAIIPQDKRELMESRELLRLLTNPIIVSKLNRCSRSS